VYFWLVPQLDTLWNYSHLGITRRSFSKRMSRRASGLPHKNQSYPCLHIYMHIYIIIHYMARRHYIIRLVISQYIQLLYIYTVHTHHSLLFPLYIPTIIYIYTYLYQYMFISLYIYINIYIYKHTYLHTYIPTYLHTYIPTYITLH
jgi:hypothetical protein